MGLELPVKLPEGDWVRDMVTEEVMQEEGVREGVTEEESVPIPLAPPQLLLVDTLGVPERVKLGVEEPHGLEESVSVTVPLLLPLPLLEVEIVAKEDREIVMEEDEQVVREEVPVPPYTPPLLVTEPLGDCVNVPDGVADPPVGLRLVDTQPVPLKVARGDALPLGVVQEE